MEYKIASVQDINWKMSNSSYEWHTRNGSMEIGNNSVWEWHPVISSELKSFIYICQNLSPANFIDIGAHCGIFSSVYCSIVNEHRCYSIEPIEGHMDRLKETADINSWNLTTHQIGLSDEKKKMYYHNTHMAMFTENADYNVPSEIVNGIPENAILKEIQIDTLDNFIVNKKIIPELIKIDVEGYEVPILRKSAELIEKYKPILFMESHRDECDNLGWKIQEMTKYMDMENYIFYTHCLSERIRDLERFLIDEGSNKRFIGIPKRLHTSL